MFERSTKAVWGNLGEFMKPYNYHAFDKGYEQLQRGTLHAVITDRNHL